MGSRVRPLPAGAVPLFGTGRNLNTFKPLQEGNGWFKTQMNKLKWSLHPEETRTELWSLVLLAGTGWGLFKDAQIQLTRHESPVGRLYYSLLSQTYKYTNWCLWIYIYIYKYIYIIYIWLQIIISAVLIKCPLCWFVILPSWIPFQIETTAIITNNITERCFAERCSSCWTGQWCQSALLFN